MLVVRALMLVLSIYMTVACAEKESDPSSMGDQRAESFAALKSMPLDCQDKDCSSRVLSLINSDPQAPSVCSAYLLDNNRVLTASHCLSPLMTTGASCGHLQLRGARLQFRCKEILFKVNLEGIEQGAITSDWALLEVEAPNEIIGEPVLGRFEFLSAPPRFVQGDPIDIYWYRSNEGRFSYHKSQCPVLVDNPFTGRVQSLSQQGLFVGPCDTVPGASGGVAIHRQSGAVIGVLSQSSNDNEWAYISFVNAD